jgi:NAD(P)-dependent dehydrogenase (short-subunit alcohol dehydrogenase family)
MEVREIDQFLTESHMKKHWNLADMPDQSNKVVVVTGATNGLGYEMGKAFALKNATLIMAVRNPELGEARAAEFRALTKSGGVEVMHVDLGDLDTVRGFAESFKSRYDRLDVLMNNAGIMAVPYGKTKDGFERHIGVNYLGHFALTGLLLDVIKRSPGCRVVNTSSISEKTGNIRRLLADFNQERGYERWTSYGHSKLAMLMFAFELNRRFEQHGVNAAAIGAHPGFARTNLRTRGMTVEPNLLHRYMNVFFEWMSADQAAGALPLLYAATDPEAEAGEYYGVHLLGWRGYPAKNRPTRQAHNRELAQRLWETSEALTGVVYAF